MECLVGFIHTSMRNVRFLFLSRRASFFARGVTALHEAAATTDRAPDARLLLADQLECGRTDFAPESPFGQQQSRTKQQKTP